MGSLFESVMQRPNKNMIYEAAMESTNSISALFKLYKEGDLEVKIDDHSFVKMFPNDINSPAIYWISDTQYIIRYPPRSKPYNHSFDVKCKFIEVLSGKLLDRNSNLKLFKGDTLKVHPKDNYAPYTLEEPCYLRVCIGNCEQDFKDVCK